MIQFEVSIAIEKPVEEVFGFVAEGENGSKWARYYVITAGAAIVVTVFLYPLLTPLTSLGVILVFIIVHMWFDARRHLTRVTLHADERGQRP